MVADSRVHPTTRQGSVSPKSLEKQKSWLIDAHLSPMNSLHCWKSHPESTLSFSRRW